MAGAWGCCHRRARARIRLFLEKGGPSRRVTEPCQGCPVQVRCLQFAMVRPSLTGIWGGASAEQRLQLRASRLDPPPHG